MEASVETKYPLVCVVVLNYNGRDHLRYCLPSIGKTDYPNYRVIVVDNASTDDPADIVGNVLPDALLIRSERNRGWSGGNNLGIVAAMGMGAKYIVLVSNDIRLDRRWLRVAVEAGEQDPRVGVVGFSVLEPQPGSDDRDAGFEDAVAAWRELKISLPTYVTGAAMLVRSEVFERIGLIDEGFLAYGEEIDFETRARKAGYCVVATNVPVWHYGEGFFGRFRLRAACLNTRHNLRLLIKHASVAQIIRRGMRHLRVRLLRSSGNAKAQSAVERRLRPSNRFVGLAILLYAVLWNLWHLPATLQRRKEDDRRAQAAHRLWDPDGDPVRDQPRPNAVGLPHWRD